MDLYFIYSWIACFNIMLIFLLMTDMPWGRWFIQYSKSYDGHIFGAIFKWWAFFCFIAGIIMLINGWDSKEALKNFMAIPKNPQPEMKNILFFARISMGFMIFTNIIPYIIGREIRSGLKILNE